MTRDTRKSTVLQSGAQRTLLIVRKTKELTVDFRKKKEAHTHISGDKVEQVNNFGFLWPSLRTYPIHLSTLVKKKKIKYCHGTRSRTGGALQQVGSTSLVPNYRASYISVNCDACTEPKGYLRTTPTPATAKVLTAVPPDHGVASLRRLWDSSIFFVPQNTLFLINLFLSCGAQRD